MIICVLLCYPLSIHVSQLLSTGRPISSFNYCRALGCETKTFEIMGWESFDLEQLNLGSLVK